MQLILASRILSPESKLSLYHNQSNYEGFKKFDLQHIYRSLDFLSSYQEDIQRHLYEHQVKNHKLDVKVVFYDVTTFYFESVKQDDLRDFGFSKDCKVNNVQVVFSMLVDGCGRPIGCDIHKGNTYEGHTMIKALDKLKSQFTIKQVVVVADKGMNNSQNILSIKKAGYDYIVSFRVKNAGKDLKEKIQDLNHYAANQYDDNGNILSSHCTLDYTRKIRDNGKTHEISSQLICTWSAKRAAKDKADRGRLIDRAEDMICNKSYKSTRGARKFLEVNIDDVVTLSEDKINQDAQWDGIYVIESSARNLTEIQVQEAYHQLWVIEESFRILKSHFESRPMFHWTPDRIVGHLVLNYIAFCFEREVEIQLKKTQSDVPISHARIRKALESMNNSIIQSENNAIKVQSRPNELANLIMEQFNLDNKKAA